MLSFLTDVFFSWWLSSLHGAFIRSQERFADGRVFSGRLNSSGQRTGLIKVTWRFCSMTYSVFLFPRRSEAEKLLIEGIDSTRHARRESSPQAAQNPRAVAPTALHWTQKVKFWWFLPFEQMILPVLLCSQSCLTRIHAVFNIFLHLVSCEENAIETKTGQTESSKKIASQGNWLQLWK